MQKLWFVHVPLREYSIVSKYVSVTFSGTSCAKIIGGPHDLDPRGFGGRPPPQAVKILTIGILE